MHVQGLIFRGLVLESFHLPRSNWVLAAVAEIYQQDMNDHAFDSRRHDNVMVPSGIHALKFPSTRVCMAKRLDIGRYRQI
jgi:hypothetical protein